MVCVCARMYVPVCVYTWYTYVGTYATDYLWRSDDNFELYVGSEVPAVICIVSPSHAASPRFLGVTLDGNSF